MEMILLATTELITNISRSKTYPKYFDVIANNNKLYLSIQPKNWTAQMFYELPFIQFDIFTNVNGEYVRYTKNSISIHTYIPDIKTYPNTPVCCVIKNIPDTCVLCVTPVFDNNAIEARNDLIKNGIEDGDLWNTITQSFDISIGTTTTGEQFPINTIVSLPPISFTSNGTPLTGYSISGNMEITSKNLYNKDSTYDIVNNVYINKNTKQEQSLSTYELSYPIPVIEGMTYRWTFNAPDGQIHSAPTVGFYNNTGVMFDAAYHMDQITTFTFTVPSGCSYIRASVHKLSKDQAMLTEGSEEIDYESYTAKACGYSAKTGYLIDISVGSSGCSITLDEPLRKALDDSGVVDTISYPEKTLIRNVDVNGNALSHPTTETIATLPEISTASGSNTLTVDVRNELQPSAMSITGHIK